jgi:serine phosphatase RsbU (regulator of sigma subunit)
MWLVGVAGNDRRVLLSEAGPVLVGRASHNHLVLNDNRLSRQHARVASERDGFVVYDLGSSNGTFVNGQTVRRQRIDVGDEVRFGPFVFTVQEQVEQVSIATGSVPKLWIQAAESVTKFFHVSEVSSAMAATLRPPGIPPGLGAPATSPMFTPQSPNPNRVTLHDDALVGAEDVAVPPAEEDRMLRTDAFDVVSEESAKFKAALKSVDLNELERAYENMTTLYAFMQAISKTIDRTELVQLMGEKLLELFRSARTVGVYLRGTENGEPAFVLEHVAGTGARPPRLLPHETSRVVEAAGRALFAPNLPSTAEVARTMFAPMIDREQVLGVIFVGTGSGGGGEFSRADLELLDGIVVPATITLQNARMHEESLRRERLNRDLELAAHIQASFLPKEVLSVPGVDMLATYKAAYTVGGDFYDLFWVGPGRVAAFVGDISGKGIAAALLMARISGEFRLAALAHVEPERVLAAMNVSLLAREQPDMFFTAFYFTLDVNTGEVRLANAGQNSPYVCKSDGSVVEITGGTCGAVGMLEDMDFVATRFILEDGDSLVLYTDGVVEAKAEGGELYGDARLDACLREGSPRPRDIAERIVSSVKAHLKGTPANDDLTIFICRRSVDAAAALQPRRFTTSEMKRPKIPPKVRVP